MGIAAVPEYIGVSFKSAPPGHRFGLYFESWNRRWEMEKDKKTGALKQVLQFNRQSKKMLRALRKRQRFTAWAFSEKKLFFVAAESTAPFVTGIGMEHPIENGFAFMNPYGLPYLPGASVKGVLRKAAEDIALGLFGDRKGWSILDVWWLFGFEAGSSYLLGEKGENVQFLKDRAKSLKERYLAWVSSTDPQELEPLVNPLVDQACERETERERYRANRQSFLHDLVDKKALRERIHQRGTLIFWDVFPEPGGEKLGIDILTPHYGEYYQGGAAPADCGQPVPNPFLTMPPESAFEFYVQYAPAGDVKGYYDNRWKALVEAAFTHAFEWLGFGAKTSLGYGQMRVDENAQKSLEKNRSAAADEERRKHEQAKKRAALKVMTPEERDIMAISDPSVTENRVVEIYSRIDEFSAENKTPLALALKKYWQAHGKWEKKNCSKKQWLKVQKVKTVLGEQ